ncbi:MAG TPA: hypothetical protein VKL99_12675 [Candidatus Angelobacter sp.]|nr:hypothetical protein [Candidatus Angelobacter sp.]
MANGSPDLVLEGYSGAAHCCWTYHIISLGAEPGLLVRFENERGAGFAIDAGSGNMEIRALDGAFDYFDQMSHAASPFPKVYLRLQGKKLIEINQEHLADYDRDIHKWQLEISGKDLSVFRQAENREEKYGFEDTAFLALQIVLAYLYSGREAQARKALEEMWPSFDQDRIWKLIFDRRSKGILRYTKRLRAEL